MKYEFEVYQMKVDSHLFWVAKSKALKGCVGQGDTSDDAIKELEINEQEWLDTAKACNIPIPPVQINTEASFSGKVSLRFSPFMHEQASQQAQKQGISLNQYINDAIVYYNSLIANTIQAATLSSETNVVCSDTTTIIDFPTRISQQPDKFQISLYNDETELEEM